eukprot:TRINITY_DN47214_c2_g1_i1.p1 TRINITY_DN47214_c2_g1~~TRINITY_DN47214_c2_g1_i1.p1  ORF type:complete len:87 (-),score=6.06 TRINITY_DN47214_c2_g1_i1:119-379(-)
MKQNNKNDYTRYCSTLTISLKSKKSHSRNCSVCKTKETPQWRNGPDGKKSLCNACGLHFIKMIKKERMVEINESQIERVSIVNLLN